MRSEENWMGVWDLERGRRMQRKRERRRGGDAIVSTRRRGMGCGVEDVGISASHPVRRGEPNMMVRVCCHCFVSEGGV